MTDHVEPGELTKVFCVDSGSVAYLSSKNMKKMPDEFLLYPTHVYQCILGKSFVFETMYILLLIPLW